MTGQEVGAAQISRFQDVHDTIPWESSGGRHLARPSKSLLSKPRHHPIAQEFVLLATAPWRSRRPLDEMAARHDLVRVKLIARQVHIDVGIEPVPVMPAGPLSANADLAEHQPTAEEILNHQRRHAALAPRRISRMPLVRRITRISAPPCTHGTLDVRQTPHAHGRHSATEHRQPIASENNVHGQRFAALRLCRDTDC